MKKFSEYLEAKYQEAMQTTPAEPIQVEDEGNTITLQYQGLEEPGAVGSMVISMGRKSPHCKFWTIDRVDTSRGWGPLLYELAMEIATQKGSGLSSGLGSTTPEAKAVWDKFYARNDVQKTFIEDPTCVGGGSAPNEHDPNSSLAYIYSKPPTRMPELQRQGLLEFV